MGSVNTEECSTKCGEKLENAHKIIQQNGRELKYTRDVLVIYEI